MSFRLESSLLRNLEVRTSNIKGEERDATVSALRDRSSLGSADRDRIVDAARDCAWGGCSFLADGHREHIYVRDPRPPDFGQMVCPDQKGGQWTLTAKWPST